MRQTRPSLGQSRGRGSNEQGRVRAFRAGSRVALALLALGLAASASAEPEPAEPPNYGHTGIYVGMGGQGVIDVSTSRFDDEVSGGGGVYGEANGRFASWIAAEVEVNYFHDTDDNDFVGIIPSLKFYYPLGRFFPYIEAGIGPRWGDLDTREGSKWGGGAKVGGGLNYNITNDWLLDFSVNWQPGTGSFHKNNYVGFSFGFQYGL